jgi:hypothetical protein
MKLFVLMGLALVAVLVSGCIGGPTSPACDTKESVVDSVILSNLENSTYIASLKSNGFELSRFRGPADACTTIPDNYVHLNLLYNKGDFSYRLTIQTKCDPSTLICDFNPDKFFEQINYLESMQFISSRIESGYYKECEVDWLYGKNDRVRYHLEKLTPNKNDLDIYLINNKLFRAMEGDIDRCTDGSLICSIGLQ